MESWTREPEYAYDEGPRWLDHIRLIRLVSRSRHNRHVMETLNMSTSTKDLKVYTVHGRKCAAHPECIDGFRSDREHSLIYPSFNVDGVIMSVERASIEAEFCAYCQVDGTL